MRAFIQFAKNSFEPLFGIAIGGVCLAIFVFFLFKRKRADLSLLLPPLLLFFLATVGWRFLSSSAPKSARYFATLIPWVVIGCTLLVKKFTDLCDRFFSRWSRAVFLLLAAIITMISCIKIFRVNHYRDYMIKLSQIFAADSAAHPHPILLSISSNLIRLQWYSGFRHTVSSPIQNRPTVESLAEQVRSFRYYDGTLYVFTDDFKNSLEAELLGVPVECWTKIASAWRDNYKRKRAEIYRMKGGDLLKRASSAGRRVSLFNGSFEGKSFPGKFLNSSPRSKVGTGLCPEGWIFYQNFSGEGRIGLEKEPGGNHRLRWEGHGETVFCSGQMLSNEPLSVDFTASGTPDSEFAVIRYVFTKDNSLVKMEQLAYLRIPETGSIHPHIAISPLAGSSSAPLRFRLAFSFFHGSVALDDVSIIRPAKTER